MLCLLGSNARDAIGIYADLLDWRAKVWHVGNGHCFSQDAVAMPFS